MAESDGVRKIKFVLMIEHPLMGYALSFMIGAYFALTIQVPTVLFIILLSVAIICVIALTLLRKKSWYFMILVFLAVGYLSCASHTPEWYSKGYVPPDECSIVGTVESVKDTGYSYEYTLRNVTVGQDEIQSKIKVSNITQRDYVDAGDKIRLKAVLERPAVAQQDGMFSQARYYMTKDIQYVATIFDSRVFILSSSEDAVSTNTKWQEKIYFRLSQDFEQPVLGIIYSLTTGNKSYMDKEIYSKSADLGIAHIFAISGLHIGALLLLWEFYCRKTKKRFLIKILGSAFLVFMLYMIVGSRASLLRAIAMWALVVIYQYAGVKGDLIDFLSIAMIVLLFINPLYVIDLGFLLSVTCVGAIGLIYVPILKAKKKDKLNRLINFYPVSMLIVSLSILAFSWVITAKAFGQVAILSPVWNIIFVPLAVVALMLMLCYALLFFVPIISVGIVWLIDNLTKIIIYLLKTFSSVNVEFDMPAIGFVAAISMVTILLLMTDVIVKGKKGLRILIGVVGIVAIMSFIIFRVPVNKLEIYAGYDSPFVYINEEDKSLLVLNDDDGGIERVLRDVNQGEIDLFLYTGNNIEKLDELLLDVEDITFKEIMVHTDLLSNYTGQNEYSYVQSGEDITFGNVHIEVESFSANKKAITHYYAHIDYYDREFIYIDPLRLRENAIDCSEIIISSRWTKQRIENIIYGNPEYVIINSNNYLMDDEIFSTNEKSIPIFNINNDGSFTYFP